MIKLFNNFVFEISKYGDDITGIKKYNNMDRTKTKNTRSPNKS